MLRGIPSLMVSRGVFVQPFDPMSIAGLRLWLEVDSLVLSDGDPVGTWTDSSLIGNDVTEATDKPTYRATGGPNSHPCVEFDGVNDKLSKIFIDGGFSQPNTIIAVYDTGRPVEINTGDRQVIISDVGTTMSCYAGSILATSPAVTAISNTFRVHTAIMNGASSANFIDGVAKGTGNAGSQGLAAISMMWFDASFPFAGKVCELLIYDSSLSDPDREDVENYLMDKYGI